MPGNLNLGVGLLALAQGSSLAFGAMSRSGDGNTLAARPPLGWNSWNKFGCDISQDTILDAARELVRTGLDKYGYEYVIIDDCWHADKRDPHTSAPLAHPKKFSKGIKHIADEVHKLGLKFGIYSSAGTHTCAGRFGSLGFEEIDAKTYASWHVDYLKYDNCYNEGQSGTPEISHHRYAVMSKALRATKRDIVYALCNWGEDGPWNWAPTIAETWRMSGDVYDTFDQTDDYCPCETVIDCKLPGYHCAVAKIIEFAAPLGQKAGPGHWNDLDMLEVGNGGQSYDEYVTHFSLWAIVKSPLILGHDITIMTDETFEIITNSAVIAINQDPQGTPASRRWKRPVENGTVQLWSGPLANGDTVVALLNLSPNNLTHSFDITEAFQPSQRDAKQLSYEFYDLWERDDSSEAAWGSLQGVLHPMKAVPIALRKHQIKVYRVRPVQRDNISIPTVQQHILQAAETL